MVVVDLDSKSEKGKVILKEHGIEWAYGKFSKELGKHKIKSVKTGCIRWVDRIDCDFEIVNIKTRRPEGGFNKL